MISGIVPSLVADSKCCSLFAVRCSQVVESGAVVSEAAECSAVGAALLRRGGAAVDAAVGALLCLGVVHPHTSGLGGSASFVCYMAR